MSSGRLSEYTQFNGIFGSNAKRPRANEQNVRFEINSVRLECSAICKSKNGTPKKIANMSREREKEWAMAPFARVDICRTFFRVPFRWNLVKFRFAREKIKIRFRRARKGCIEAESNVLVQVWIFQRSDLPTVMRLNKLSKDTDTLSMVFARPKKTAHNSL